MGEIPPPPPRNMHNKLLNAGNSEFIQQLIRCHRHICRVLTIHLLRAAQDNNKLLSYQLENTSRI